MLLMQIHQMLLQADVTIYSFGGKDQQWSKHDVRECPANRVPYLRVLATASLFYTYP